MHTLVAEFDVIIRSAPVDFYRGGGIYRTMQNQEARWRQRCTEFKQKLEEVLDKQGLAGNAAVDDAHSPSV